MRVSVLVLGSMNPQALDADGLPVARFLARALAAELHDWLQRSIARDLRERARLTAEELALLQHERAGHRSKDIARLMNVGPRVIDCRFQRLCAKLGVQSRRDAVHLVQVHGLLS